MTSTSKGSASSVVPNQNQTPCPHCGKYFSRVSTHITRSHPDKHRERIVERHVHSDNLNVKDVTSSHGQKSSNENSQTVQSKLFSKDIATFEKKFSELLQQAPCPVAFNVLYNEFVSALQEMGSKLPGPKHPAVRYFEMRKQRKKFLLLMTGNIAILPTQKEVPREIGRKDVKNIITTSFNTSITTNVKSVCGQF